MKLLSKEEGRNVGERIVCAIGYRIGGDSFFAPSKLKYFRERRALSWNTEKFATSVTGWKTERETERERVWSKS